MGESSTGIYPDCSFITRTVTLGGLSKREILRQFETHSISMNAKGLRLLEELSYSDTDPPRDIETVEVTVAQLGFPDGATRPQLFLAAAALGLELCPLELGPLLRLHYLDQPEGFWITIASHNPSDEVFPSGYYLRRLPDGLWLRGYSADDEWLWKAEEHFIFCVSSQAVR